MQSSDEYHLSKQEIESGIQVIKRKVLAFFNDAKILANHGGEPSHCVGLYLFGVEEFGKLLILKDSLSTNPIGGQYAVDMSIFGKGSDNQKRAQAHNSKFNQALQILPKESINRSQSVIVKTALSKPVAFMSGTGPVFDIGTVRISENQTGTFSDTQAPTSKFTVGERVGGFLVDWDDKGGRWISSEIQTEAGRVQISLATSDLLRIINNAENFVKAYH